MGKPEITFKLCLCWSELKHAQRALILPPSGEKPGHADWQTWTYLLMKALARAMWWFTLQDQSTQALSAPRLGPWYCLVLFFDTFNTGHGLSHFPEFPDSSHNFPLSHRLCGAWFSPSYPDPQPSTQGMAWEMQECANGEHGGRINRAFFASWLTLASYCWQCLLQGYPYKAASPERERIFSRRVMSNAE